MKKANIAAISNKSQGTHPIQDEQSPEAKRNKVPKLHLQGTQTMLSADVPLNVKSVDK